MADDPRQQQLQQELADCVMGASWLWCVAGVAAAVPLGVKKKVRAVGGSDGGGARALARAQWLASQRLRARDGLNASFNPHPAVLHARGVPGPRGCAVRCSPPCVARWLARCAAEPAVAVPTCHAGPPSALAAAAPRPRARLPGGLRGPTSHACPAARLAGTLLDLLSGYDKCKDQRQALERHMASKDASGRGPASREPQAAARRQQQEQQQQQREAGAAAAAAGGQRPGA